MLKLMNANYSIAPEQLNSRLGEEMAVLDLQSGTYFGLNPVATRVWELVQEGKCINSIRKTLLGEYDVAPDVLEKDLNELFESMLAQGLLRKERAVCAGSCGGKK